LQLMETTASLKRPPQNEIRSFLEAKPMSNQSLDAFTFRTCVYFWPGRKFLGVGGWLIGGWMGRRQDGGVPS
ncbi:MAG: hypothetical protein IJL17_16525, partial [Kiritimatiellae bacterium]|nr:hypothetical protein [Kiritimatiellia bacterium]